MIAALIRWSARNVALVLLAIYVLADLAALPRAAVVVEERYAKVFELTLVRPAVVADALAECQARFPAVPIIFVETCV